MKISVLFFFLGLSAGLFFISADLLKLPRLATERALISAGRSGQSVAKRMEVLILSWANRLKGYVRLSDYRRNRLSKALSAAGLDMTPEVYVAYSILKPALILLGALPCLLILPILSPLVVLLAILTYFQESRRADTMIAEHMAAIQSELPRFVATIEQELSSSRDVLRILDNYRKYSSPEFTRELNVLIADMRSSSYEAALIRFEAHMGSAVVSDIVRGLISVLHGDDGRMYFQMLAHDLKQVELQRLKAQAGKIPPKIRVFSFVMLMCFMLTYVVIIGYQIVQSLGSLF